MATRTREIAGRRGIYTEYGQADGFHGVGHLPVQRFETDTTGSTFEDLAIRYGKEALPEHYDEAQSFDFHPVYPTLKHTLATADQHPNAMIAHALGTCSAYSYSDAETLSMIMTRMGLEGNHCHMVSEVVDAMLIDSTAFLVESDDGEVVILSYRGTQPFSVLNLATSIDLDAQRVPLSVAGANGQFEVDGSFYRNVRATRHKVADALIRALQKNDSVVEDKSVLMGNSARGLKNLQALYITGHSLGGAMAALMTVMLLSEPKYEPIAKKLKAVYTFAQPMVGSADFADACQKDPTLRDKVLRYVYKEDVVPAVPPRISGHFAHFGQELKYDGENWVHQRKPTQQISELQTPFAIRAITPFLTSEVPFLDKQLGKIFPFTLLNDLADWIFPYSLRDHLPEHYVSALAPNREVSEFGDEY